MSNKDYTDEIKKYENEANTLSNDEEFHSKDLSEAELSKKTAERNYYIEFKDNEGNLIKKIYVDRHDYILYKRPIWAEWKREQLAKRCLIPNGKGGYKHCMNDCSLCNKCKNRTLVSLDSLREDHNFEPITDNDGTILFSLSDICKLLGVCNSTSIKEKLNRDDRCKTTESGKKIYVGVNNVIRLIFQTKNDFYNELTDWLSDKVILLLFEACRIEIETNDKVDEENEIIESEDDYLDDESYRMLNKELKSQNSIFGKEIIRVS